MEGRRLAVALGMQKEEDRLPGACSNVQERIGLVTQAHGIEDWPAWLPGHAGEERLAGGVAQGGD